MHQSVLGVPCRVWLFLVAALTIAFVPIAKAQQSDPPAKLLGVVLTYMVDEDYVAAKSALVEELEFRPSFSDLVIMQFKEKSAEIGDPRSYWVTRRVVRLYSSRPFAKIHNVRAMMEYEDGFMWETLFQFHFADHRWRLGSFRPLAQWRDENESPD